MLRDAGSAEGSVVNGVAVRDALLRPGDQVVFDLQHRFVVEAPMGRSPASLLTTVPKVEPDSGERSDGPTKSLPNSARRIPWLLLAAVLLSAALSLLLLYGAR